MMVPKSIRKQLGRLRRREILLRLAWGGSRWLAVSATLLALACLVDWAVDKEQDTPQELRQGLFIVQVNAAGLAVWQFLLRPLLKGGLRTDRLAMQVESRFPELEQRLITTVQLNRRHARTDGMSPELIAQVTRETEALSAGIRFTNAAGRRRLVASALLACPIAAAVLTLLALEPELTSILVARQFLQDRDIPRTLTIQGITREVHPIGEEVTLRFSVAGRIPDEIGEVLVEPDALIPSRHGLVLEKQTDAGTAVFSAHIPSVSSDFAYRAWLGDGRTRKAMRIRFVPRPVVEEITAWVLLPTYCDPERRRRLPQLQSWGDITGIPESWGRVEARLQKPCKEAFVELLAAPAVSPDGNQARQNAALLRKVKMAVDKSGKLATGVFELKTEEHRYRIIAVDEHGFVNLPPPERKLRIVPETPPRVALLPEVLAPSRRFNFRGGDFDMEGIPALLGGSMPVAYTCSGHFGLGQARLLFRIRNNITSGNESPPPEEWRILPLAFVKETNATGKFDPRRGTFANSGPAHQVFFHAVSFTDPNYPLRSFGGGHFDFKTNGIPDGKGGFLSLNAGDQIEYCIEVFADREVDMRRPAARSEVRVKTLVEYPELVRWIDDSLQETRRLQALTARQGDVFEQK